MLKKGILLFSFITVAAISTAFIAGNEQLFEISKQLDIFTSLFKELNIYYVDEVNDEKLTRKAIDAMLENLDPYSEYYPETELEEYKMRYVSTEYGGIGALIQTRNEQIVISEPYEGFPAQQNDIRAGDVLLEVDGKSIKNFPADDVSSRLKGKPETKIKILLKRGENTKPIEKTVVRKEIKFGNISYSGLLENNVGYIRLDKFLNNCYADFRTAFQDVKAKGATSLIIDLRSNGGGILQEAVQIINLFVPKDETIVTQKGKLPEMNSQYKAVNEPLDTKIPIVVLVDTATASASEITAGAMQDLDRGIVIGQRTFGKGLVQQTKPLVYNAQLKITVAKYYTPSGRCVQAINYAKKDAKGKAKTVPDSLIAEFKTKNGRSVYDGSGIAPDVKLELPEYSSLLLNLISKNIIFDFATDYRNRNATLQPAKNFKISDAEYQLFCEYAKKQHFDYQTASIEKLKELKKAAEEEKYYNQIKDEYTDLEKVITPNIENDLIRYKTEIKEFLENEIVSRYYFQTGRLEHLLYNYDSELNKALTILKQPDLYKSILTGKDEYRYIGKPVKNKK